MKTSKSTNSSLSWPTVKLYCACIIAEHQKFLILSRLSEKLRKPAWYIGNLACWLTTLTLKPRTSKFFFGNCLTIVHRKVWIQTFYNLDQPIRPKNFDLNPIIDESFIRKCRNSSFLVYSGTMVCQWELRWTLLNFLSPFPGFFYEILLEHCAKNQL